MVTRIEELVMNRNKKTIVFIIVIMFAYPAYSNEKNNTFTLQQCIEYAQKHNTVINRADNAIKSTQSSLAQSKTALLPDLGITVSPNASYPTSYSSNDGTGQSGGSSNANVTAMLSSTIRLYEGGRLRNTIQQNNYALSANIAAKQTQEELLEIELLSSYINVLLAKEQVKNSIVQLQSTQKQLEYAEVRNTVGVISKADYLNIKSQVSADKVDSVEVQHTLHLNLITLMQKMNMPVDYQFDIAEPDIETLLDSNGTTDAEYIYNQALENRPEIKTAEFNLESSIVGVEIAKAASKPSLSLSTGVRASADYDRVNSLDNAGAKSLSPSISLSLSIPMYQRGTVVNQTMQARIAADNSQYDLDDIKNDLRKIIEQTCSDLLGAYARYTAMHEQYLSEQESYRIAEEMFGQGLTNSVNYLTSKNNLATVVGDLTQTKYVLVLHKKQIDYYLGNPITL